MVLAGSDLSPDWDLCLCPLQLSAEGQRRLSGELGEAIGDYDYNNANDTANFCPGLQVLLPGWSQQAGVLLEDGTPGRSRAAASSLMLFLSRVETATRRLKGFLDGTRRGLQARARRRRRWILRACPPTGRTSWSLNLTG